MGNKIELKSISDLLGMNFFIPSYQRGYRWTKQQVKDLLEDIDSFDPQKDLITNKESWYCLQPLVVRKLTDDEVEEEKLNNSSGDWFEVVDGQQRITTIFLFIHYFNEKWIGEDKLLEPQIKYQTRTDSSDFLRGLKIDNESNKVIVDHSKNDEIIDYYHIAEAYQTIRNWVIEKVNLNKNLFQSKFIFNTQVIWYEINNNNPIDTFIRINMGKIPLTNSELIKALFLQKRNFGTKGVAELRQIEIANEWDKIEYSLQNNDFWWFLNRKENEIPARIEFLFDIIYEVAKSEDPELIKKIGTDQYATFRYFNGKFPNNLTFKIVKDEWNNIKDYFLAFEEWYNDIIWYHYVGYLIYCGNSIVEIYKLFKDCPKDGFTQQLKEMIKNNLRDIRYSKKEKSDKNVLQIDEIVNTANSFLNINTNLDSVPQQYTYNIELQFDNKSKTKIREILVLYNLQYIINQYENIHDKSKGELNIRFPFELFKREKWDVEHIDSYTKNAITDKKVQVEWLKFARIDTGDELDDLKDDIINFIESKKNSRSFDELKQLIIEKVGEISNDEETKNGIGNLTLLSSDINRSYGNALFSSKRRVIIEKDNEGKFIPICTKNVFLKYFDKEGFTRTQWTENDIENYQNSIGNILDVFLTFKENSNE